jgi:uncharacterized repeat protein (TIGR03803 family)
MKSVLTLILLSVLTPLAAHAQFFTKLADFHGTNGAGSEDSMVESVDGNLYGTTNVGGTGVAPAGTDGGSVFRFSPASGAIATLYSFCQTADCPTGEYPASPLTLSHSGNLYGTSQGGGVSFGGTVFEITQNDEFHLFYSFCVEASCPDGSALDAGLVQASDGNFYGGTSQRGPYGLGTLFKMTPRGQVTTIHSFCAESGCPDGARIFASLIDANDGNLYGTTTEGGGQNMGTIFKLTPSGVLTTLYSFCSQPACSDGAVPATKLLQGKDGHFYGLTIQGGTNGTGTFFRLTAKGVFTTLYSFCSPTSCADGSYPEGDIVQATDGNFYGTSGYGGDNNFGTVFRIRPNGKFERLYSFHNGFDGGSPDGLVQGTDGKLYGTAGSGGFRGAPCTPHGCGTVYSLSMGLNPFVKLLLPSGKVGATTTIYGMNASGATAVTFNGTAATFTQASPTQITATVPAGATTGTIQVVTPAGTLSSNVVFHVLP